MDKSKADTANAPQALAVKLQNFKYLFFIKKPLSKKLNRGSLYIIFI